MDYFSEVFNQDLSDMKNENMNTKICDFIMPELVITEKKVAEKLDNLKVDKSSGVDTLHPRVFKELKNELVNPLKQIFEISLKSGKLPEDWRSGIITAIHKKGSKAKVENYRPISLTCIACKLMESIPRRGRTYRCSIYRF